MKPWPGSRRLLNPLDRTIIVVTSLFLLLLAGWTAASGYGWDGRGSGVVVLHGLGIRAVEATLLAVVMLLAALHLFFLGIHQQQDEAIRQETELGHVSISLRAIETLVQRTAKEIRGIKDVDVAVAQSPEGVAVGLSLVISSDASVPTLSTDVGRQVQEQVRETIGIDVGNVAVEIKNIAAHESRVRVE